MKTPSPFHCHSRAGLTLVELLVVIAIVIVLVGLVMPPCSPHIQRLGRLTDSLNNAKQTSKALRMYAEDHEGHFPSTRTDGARLTSGDSSNRALEQLMSKYVSSKVLFRNKSSAWCRKPEEDTLPGDANILKRGQNDWNYVAGLTMESDPRWPLIATATASATELTYTKSTAAKGGVWGGTAAIVGYPDGSARRFMDDRMNLKDETKTFPKREDTGANIFIRTSDWLSTGQVVLAPE